MTGPRRDRDLLAQFRSTGDVLATPGALEALSRSNRGALGYINRHIRGDWGDLDDEDKQANEAALQTGARLLSSYFLPDETKIFFRSSLAASDIVKHNL